MKLLRVNKEDVININHITRIKHNLDMDAVTIYLINGSGATYHGSMNKFLSVLSYLINAPTIQSVDELYEISNKVFVHKGS